MKSLYAYPDHEVVAELIPGITDRHLTPEEAVSRMAVKPGIIPVAIDHRQGGRIYCADIGTHPFREWQFMYSIRHLAQENTIGEAFTTDFSLLARDDLPADTVEPEGFVFHISRCGSTLMAKALARLPRTHVITQGGPLQRGFWATITGDFAHAIDPTPENLASFRSIVRLMARDRGSRAVRSFVKFISWNSLYIDFVQQAFPNVPALFLYRDPVEVIASVLRETTAVLTVRDHRQASFLTGLGMSEIRKLDDTAYLAKCFARYFETVLNVQKGKVSLLNYVDLTPAQFEDIVRSGLGLRPSAQDIKRMLEQFRYHSKDDKQKAKFHGDSKEKRAEMPAGDKATINRECKALLNRLDTAPNNLFTAR